MEINLSEHFTYKKLIKFTLHTIAMMIFTSIYGVVDGLFVSNVVGNNAFASINLIFPPIMMIGTIGFMIGTVGSAPIISYHFGAGDKIELKSLLSKSIKLLGLVAIIMTLLAEILAKPLAMIFVSYDEELLKLTTNAIRLFSISYIISWFNIFTSSFFTALNNGIVSAVISFLRTFVFQVIMIYLLPYFWGVDGIWLAVFVAELLSLVVSLVFLIINKKRYGYV